MIELQDKLSDVMDTIGITCQEYLPGEGDIVSCRLLEYPSYFNTLEKISRSLYADKMIMQKNEILIYLSTVWVKGQRYKIRAFVHFVFSKGFLSMVYIKATTYVYTGFDGVTRNFVAVEDLMNTMRDDRKMKIVDSMGALSNV